MLCILSNNNKLFKDLSFLYDFLSFLTFDLRRMGLECIIKKYKFFLLILVIILNF